MHGDDYDLYAYIKEETFLQVFLEILKQTHQYF